MFFTSDDYNRIAKWLYTHGLKDSDFKDAKFPLSGAETMVLVQGGDNVKTKLKDFARYLKLMANQSLININDQFGMPEITLTEAIRLIPPKMRKQGQLISFKDTDGKWNVYQFQGERISSWETLSSWVNLLTLAASSAGAVPDEEDLAVFKENEIPVIKFNNKNYNPDVYSGTGRIFLRKNITYIEGDNPCEHEELNLLWDGMFPSENTIYVIQYDYSLNGMELKLPKDCVLRFEGGSISDGTLIGDNTLIISSGGNAIFKNCSLEGTFCNKYNDVSWFEGNYDYTCNTVIV